MMRYGVYTPRVYTTGVTMRRNTDDVPNQPRTPGRSVRIDTPTWDAAKRNAARRQESVSDVVRDVLEAYNLLPDKVWAGAATAASVAGLSMGQMIAEAVTDYAKKHEGGRKP